MPVVSGKRDGVAWQRNERLLQDLLERPRFPRLISFTLQCVEVGRRHNEILSDLGKRHHIKPFRSLKRQHRTADQRLVIGHRPDCSRHGSGQESHLHWLVVFLHPLENRNKESFDKRVDGGKSEIRLFCSCSRYQFAFGRFDNNQMRLNLRV